MGSRTLFLLTLLLFICEGPLFYWLFPPPWRSGVVLTPHLALVGVLFVAIFRNRHLGFLFGLIFGFMHDIVYASPMTGTHAFCMAMAGYGAGAVAGRIKPTAGNTVMLLLVTLAFYDGAVYALYRFFQVTFFPFGDMITAGLLPSLAFNLLLVIVVYVPVRKLLERKADKREEESAGV